MPNADHYTVVDLVRVRWNHTPYLSRGSSQSEKKGEAF